MVFSDRSLDIFTKLGTLEMGPVREKEFKPKNERDSKFALWNAINARLDRLGEKVGKGKLTKELTSYKGMLAEAEGKCGGFATNQTDCFFDDIGCGIKCLDIIGGGEVAQKVQGKQNKKVRRRGDVYFGGGRKK